MLWLTEEAIVGMKKLYYEDIEVGFKLRFGYYRVTHGEIVSFAEKWDPQPFHLDELAGRESVFGSIIACAAHIFAIKNQLRTSNPTPYAYLAGLGVDEMRLITPVRPDDVLSLEAEVINKRPSSKNSDRGIVTTRYRLMNH